MLYIMEAARTVQTAFRFRPELVEKLKRKARKERTSVNAFVEKVLEKELSSDEDRYEALFKKLESYRFEKDHSASEIIDRLAGCIQFTEEEIEKDERLKYLLNK